MFLMFAVSVAMLKISPRTADTISVADTSAQSGTYAYSSMFDGEDAKFVAHRGYSNYAPENSIAAFETAGKFGFWGIETDVYETTDGAFVCMHDEELDRTTNGEGKITDYSLSQLAEFEIDTGNNIETTENKKIPTVNEYLEICARYGCAAIVEIKTIRNYDALLALIRDSGLHDNCVVMGNINDMWEIRARDADIPVMTIGYTPAPYTDSLADITQIPNNRGVLYNYPQVDAAAINSLHEQGIYCGVWSIDDKDVAQQYIDYGADFVVTNEIPAVLDYMPNENE